MTHSDVLLQVLFGCSSLECLIPEMHHQMQDVKVFSFVLPSADEIDGLGLVNGWMQDGHTRAFFSMRSLRRHRAMQWMFSALDSPRMSRMASMSASPSEASYFLTRFQVAEMIVQTMFCDEPKWAHRLQDVSMMDMRTRNTSTYEALNRALSMSRSASINTSKVTSMGSLFSATDRDQNECLTLSYS